MKLKKWLTVSAMTAGVLLGGMAVQADSLTLSGGEVLDLGSTVNVYDGERSFFGSQIHDWLIEGQPAESIEKVLVKENVFPSDTTYAKEVSQLAAEVLKSGKVYQVRAAANDTYYQGLVISLSLSDSQQKKLAVYQKAALENKEKAESDALVSTLLNACQNKVAVKSHSDWQEKKGPSGKTYRTGDVQLSLQQNGLVLPLFLKGILIKEEGGTTYTLLAGDQVSGQYLAPFFDKALQGAKK